jgi:hypothetical protein
VVSGGPPARETATVRQHRAPQECTTIPHGQRIRHVSHCERDDISCRDVQTALQTATRPPTFSSTVSADYFPLSDSRQIVCRPVSDTCFQKLREAKSIECKRLAEQPLTSSAHVLSIPCASISASVFPVPGSPQTYMLPAVRLRTPVLRKSKIWARSLSRQVTWEGTREECTTDRTASTQTGSGASRKDVGQC